MKEQTKTIGKPGKQLLMAAVVTVGLALASTAQAEMYPGHPGQFRRPVPPPVAYWPAPVHYVRMPPPPPRYDYQPMPGYYVAVPPPPPRYSYRPIPGYYVTTPPPPPHYNHRPLPPPQPVWYAWPQW